MSEPLMNQRLLERQEFHRKCFERGWPQRCSDCGDGLEDPRNSDYDAFCDFCCAYYIFDDRPKVEG